MSILMIGPRRTRTYHDGNAFASKKSPLATAVEPRTHFAVGQSSPTRYAPTECPNTYCKSLLTVAFRFTVQYVAKPGGNS